MRSHRKYAALSFPRSGARLRDLVSLPNLTAARIEPVPGGTVFLDCVFQQGDSIAAIALIEVAMPMLDRRESSPFVWPDAAAQHISHEAASAIEDALLPWVESEAFNRPLNSERLRFFGGAGHRADFDRARTSGFLGAAPYADVLRAAAPYIYVSRYARNKRVRCDDAGGASGAALLSHAAASVSATLGSQDADTFANRWFDSDIFGRDGANAGVSIGSADRAAVHVDLLGATGSPVRFAAPFPLDVPMEFGITLPAHEPQEIPLPAFPAAGGSSGRILLLLRDDFALAPDADSDAALLLAQRLRAEGFTVDAVAASAAEPSGYDLVHCCCAQYPEQALFAVRRARALGIPVVMTLSPGTRDGEASWGTSVVPQILRIAHDETILEDHLRLMRARKLEAPGATMAQEPFPGFREAERELQSLVAASVPAGAAPFLPEAAVAARPPVEGGYVLVHAPLHPRCNQFAAVRAAAKAGLPIVLAGPDADGWYAGQVRAYAPAGSVFVPEPQSVEELLGLYSGARVYAAAAWTRLGEGRLALARAVGCRIATADPADEEALAAALKAAWDEPAPGALVPQADPLTEVILAYSNCAPAGRNT
ncbi:MAG TPA: hypothetical protein VFL13_15835 [Candidatus Baltobacteraceae bacterium]|nr:hypothetical protein [Candidatus Baltobacteraceae bacterium]